MSFEFTDNGTLNAFGVLCLLGMSSLAALSGSDLDKLAPPVGHGSRTLLSVSEESHTLEVREIILLLLMMMMMIIIIIQLFFIVVMFSVVVIIKLCRCCASLYSSLTHGGLLG